MPLRPQLPAGLNLSRRVATPVKLPKMTFPMGEGYGDEGAEASVPAAPAMAGPGSGPAGGQEASRARLALFQQLAQAPPYEQPAPAPARAAPPVYERFAPPPAQAAPPPAQAAPPAYERFAPPPAQAAPPVYERPAPAPTPPAYERAAPAPPAYERPAPAPPAPTVPAAQAHQIIIYGRAGCEASIAAIQDLIDREMSFTYYDVGRDPQAMAHLQAICGHVPMVPVIIQIGFDGA